MSQTHFDLIENYDAEIPVHVREYLASRKTDLILNESRAVFGDRRLKMLDVGCGTGWHVKALAQHGHDVCGIDSAEKQVLWANANDPLGTITRGDLLSIPYEDDTFDVSYTINALHHLSSFEEQKVALGELARVTKRDGLVIVHEMNTRNPVIRLYLNYIFPRLRSIDEGEGIEQWILPARWQQVENFALKKITYFTFIPDFTPRFLFPLFRLLESFLERTPLDPWSAHYMAVLQNRKTHHA